MHTRRKMALISSEVFLAYFESLDVSHRWDMTQDKGGDAPRDGECFCLCVLYVLRHTKISPALGSNFLLGQGAGELLVCLGFSLCWRMWAFGQVKEVFWESSGQTPGVSV